MEYLVILLLGGLYVGGGWKFWKGFRYTNFQSGRLLLTLLWPILLFNKSYRQNFAKTLR